MNIGPLGTETVHAIGWTLLHFLWQGAAAAALLAAVNPLLRWSAELRYAAAATTLLAMLALPVGTFVALRPAGSPATVGLTQPPESRIAVPLAAVPDGSGSDLPARLTPMLPWLVGGWCLGVTLLSLHSLGGWILAQRLKRSGRPAAFELEQAMARIGRELRVSRPVRLCVSALVEVPTVIGWLRPVVLLPAGALIGMSATQLELVLAHELAHVRRYDYLVNLLQTAVETLLFYHPAVWWVSGRMRFERELCCDDLAVAACGNALGYARALTRLEDLRVSAPRLALAASGGSLAERVARLLGRPAQVARSSRWAAGLPAIVVALIAGLGAAVQPITRASVAAPQSGEELQTPAPQPSETPAKFRRARVPAKPAQPVPGAESAPAPERSLPIAAVLELANAGVTPEYVDQMDALGYRSLSWEQLLALRRQGVGPDYVRGLAGEGFAGLPAEQLLALRSTGVSPDYVRGLKEAGLAGLTISDLLALRSQGVSPEFVREMKGVAPGDASVSRLLALRAHGVDPDYVRGLESLGYGGLTAARLVGLRSMGVTADFVKELKALGYADLTVPTLIALRSHGVTPDYVRELQLLGYRGLAAGTLIELRSHGVSAEYARQMREAGFKDLTPEELIGLRSQGVQPDLLQRLRARWRPREEKP